MITIRVDSLYSLRIAILSNFTISLTFRETIYIISLGVGCREGIYIYWFQSPSSQVDILKQIGLLYTYFSKRAKRNHNYSCDRCFVWQLTLIAVTRKYISHAFCHRSTVCWYRYRYGCWRSRRKLIQESL